MWKILIFLIVFYPLKALSYSEILPLIKISDGDTIKVLMNGEKQSVRLLDIDCYETQNRPRAIKQSEYYNIPLGEVYKKGKYNKQVLEDLLKKEKEVRIIWEKKDGFKRILGKVYRLDGLDINEYMLKSGGCNPFIRF